MTHFNFLSFALVTHISPPPSIQTTSYCIPFESCFNPLSNEGISMIHNNGGKVLYSKYSNFLYLFLHSEYRVFIAGEESHPVEHISLAILTFKYAIHIGNS